MSLKVGDHMTKLRYNRAFKKGIAAILFCIILFGSIVVFFVVSKIQYDRLVSDMESLEATIVDIDYKVHYKGPGEQEIYIEYVVDGIVYSRELETDTTISFAAGRGAHYSIGDKVKIFYDAQNPEIIASPRSVAVGYFWLIFALLFLILVLFVLFWTIKSRRKFLVTQAEYDREGDEIKRSKSAGKKQKAQMRAERKSRHPKIRKAGRTILIILGVLFGAFIIFLLFGLFLMSIGYGAD